MCGIIMILNVVAYYGFRWHALGGTMGGTRTTATTRLTTVHDQHQPNV